MGLWRNQWHLQLHHRAHQRLRRFHGDRYPGSTSTLASTQVIRNGAFDTLGNLFLTDDGLGSLIEITPTSGVAGATALPTFSALADGAGGTVGANNYAVAIDASNDPYTVTYAGQGNCHKSTSANTPACEYIKYTKSGSTYTPTNLFNSLQAGAPSVRDMVVDDVSSSSGLGNVWAASIGDTSDSTLAQSSLCLTPSTGALAVITLGTKNDEPYGVALDKSGNGYVTTEASTSSNNYSALYYVPQGTATGSITSTVSTSGATSTLKYIPNTNSAPASTANPAVPVVAGGLLNPYYDEVDGAGNVWIANNNNASIVEYSPSLSGFLSPYYGFTPSIAIAQTATITAYSITSNVVTFTANQAFTAGETLTLSSFPTSTFFNGQTITVLATGLTTTSFEANFTHANVTATTEAGLATSTVNASNQALFTCTTVSGTTTCGVFGLANKHSLQSLAIDRAGSVWSMDSGGTLLEIIGTAAPTNPVLAAGQAGTLP